MKILKCPDCEITSPPSTCFIWMPEEGVESDLAQLAEMRDLPTANRAYQVLRKDNLELEKIEAIVEAGRTSRVGMQSLAAHLEGSFNTSEKYIEKIINAATNDFGCDRETLLPKGFLRPKLEAPIFEPPSLFQHSLRPFEEAPPLHVGGWGSGPRYDAGMDCLPAAADGEASVALG
ncbi:MAG TPA: hypothetical protein VIL86_17610 [Tepidisphaeraceae bacterium]|jgi:hypothetical protein